MARQVELADDLGPQQRDDVRADRELEAREDLFGDGRAAEHVPPLEHEHLAPRAREIGRVHEAVVAAADDDDVVVVMAMLKRSLNAESLRRARLTNPLPVWCLERVRAAVGIQHSELLYSAMPIGTAVHERTFALCESLNYREWSGYYAVSAYESAPRARIQRDPQRRGADRRVAALQVPGHRPRRAALRRSADHARRRRRWRSARCSTRRGATSTAR